MTMSWSFKRQAGFFTTVEYTGNGVSGRALAHDLGATPGLVLIKRRDNVSSWAAWHRGLPAGHYIRTDTNAASVADTARGWGTGSPKTIRLNGGGTEYSTDSGAAKTTTGFNMSGMTDGSCLYWAIRKDI